MQPFFGQCMRALEAVLLQANAEIIITFEGTTESGNDFMARQSYLPNELKWGHCFSNIISLPTPGSSQYTIDFSGYPSLLPPQCCPLEPAVAFWFVRASCWTCLLSMAAPTANFGVLPIAVPLSSPAAAACRGSQHLIARRSSFLWAASSPDAVLFCSLLCFVKYHTLEYASEKGGQIPHRLVKALSVWYMANCSMYAFNICSDNVWLCRGR